MADQTVQSKFTPIGGGEIQIGLTRKPITAWGGMSVFAAFGESIGLRGALERALSVLPRNSPNALPASELALGFIVGVLTGATRFLHLERLRADQPLREMFGLKRFVVPSTYTRFFQAFGRQHQEDVFTSLTRWSLGLLPKREAGYTLDLDSTVLERWGEQEGVAPGYNPRRHGRPTQHPLLAGLAEARWLLHGWLRAGNASSANNVIAFLRECLALIQGLVSIALVRADSGFFDQKTLMFLEEENLHYLIKARFTKRVIAAASGTTNWTRVDRGLEVADAQVQLQGWTKPRRIVIIRQEVEARPKAPGKALFDWKGYRFQAIVTSHTPEEMPAVIAYRKYNERGEFENRIKELKAGCGLEGFCMNAFTATECVLKLLCLVHNLVQHFQDAIGLRPASEPITKDKTRKRHTLETLRTTFLCCAAVLGSKARNRILRLSGTPAWMERFLQALQRISPPKPKRKAAPQIPGQLPLFSNL